MTEVLPTNLSSFHAFLIAESHTIGEAASESDFARNGEHTLGDAPIWNALHFMRDVELFQAKCVDETLEDLNDYEGSATESDVRWNVESAQAINFCMSAIRQGNPAVIEAISGLALQDIHQYGIVDFSENGTSADIWGRAACDRHTSLLNFIKLTVPDFPFPE